MDCPTCSFPLQTLGCQLTGGDARYCLKCGCLSLCNGTLLVPETVLRLRLLVLTADDVIDRPELCRLVLDVAPR